MRRARRLHAQVAADFLDRSGIIAASVPSPRRPEPDVVAAVAAGRGGERGRSARTAACIGGLLVVAGWFGGAMYGSEPGSAGRSGERPTAAAQHQTDSLTVPPLTSAKRAAPEKSTAPKDDAPENDAAPARPVSRSGASTQSSTPSVTRSSRSSQSATRNQSPATGRADGASRARSDFDDASRNSPPRRQNTDPVRAVVDPLAGLARAALDALSPPR